MEDRKSYPSRARARLSTSISKSTSRESESLGSPQPLIRETEDDFDSDTRALAREIQDYWKVERPDLVIGEFGKWRIQTAHRRMLFMSRSQKLTQVRDLAAYFMRILINLRDGAPATVDDDADARIAAYRERQQRRGQQQAFP